jgi:hypothetical protein
VWDCKVIDNRLFVNHNKGLFEINGNRVKFFPGSGGTSITNNPTNPTRWYKALIPTWFFTEKTKPTGKLTRLFTSLTTLSGTWRLTIMATTGPATCTGVFLD